MKKPMPPPPFEDVLLRLYARKDQENVFRQVLELYRETGVAGEPYLPWDELRYKEPPDGLDTEQWWAALKYARRGMQRRLPLADAEGAPFIYALPDEVLRNIDYITSYTSGRIGTREEVTDPVTRDRYLVSQLIEEAITSSQLEGAATSRKVANEMLRTGRKPRDRSELMILNNYRAMQRVGELRNERMSIDLVQEIHRIVTEGTLDNPDSAGRFERPDEVRVAVWDENGQLLHQPPLAKLLPERMQRVCDFANGDDTGAYLPGVLRALVVHFMVGYEHPFEDGNGRTARALFYWSMLNQGYWLAEFLSISRILKRAHAKYARSFLHTELDENDLTYFFTYHLDVIRRAIVELNQYLSRKAEEVRELRATLRINADFNARQIALVNHALKTPGGTYTVQSHRSAHRVSTETARSDLLGLVARGLLAKRRSSKRFVFEPVPHLDQVIKDLDR